MDWERAAARRGIMDWRDRHLLAAERDLNAVAVDLLAEYDADLNAADWRDLTFGSGALAARVLGPRISAAAETIADTVLEVAGRELTTLIASPLGATGPRPEVPPGMEPEGWRDLAMAIGPVATALGVAAAIPTAAVSTGAAMFGLVTFSVVSWPVVAVGGLVASAALVTGAVNGGRIREKAIARAREQARAQVATALLEVTGERPSALSQIEAALDGAAATSLEKIA